jgi:glycosyltransferase involved in cell wall biosynthesis
VNIEAKAMRKPVVTFGIGGIGEYTRADGQVVYAREAGGGSVGERLVEDMAAEVARLLDDAGERRRIGEEGRAMAEGRTVQRMVNEYLLLYKELGRA